MWLFRLGPWWLEVARIWDLKNEEELSSIFVWVCIDEVSLWLGWVLLNFLWFGRKEFPLKGCQKRKGA